MRVHHYQHLLTRRAYIYMRVQIFANFNQLFKVGKDSFMAWARILKVPLFLHALGTPGTSRLCRFPYPVRCPRDYDREQMDREQASPNSVLAMLNITGAPVGLSPRHP